ncbi:enoyl-CoA hydratase domain-containing protein 3, mitochondrial-like [Haliotis rubra]|uniref:enoyl-CoA hydratase domain-containing protein 3, mitochondrial-like n=1 Tax=Haliotis rubra TaxID=36100 RepID=UPI001EE5A6C1|nr:enoyl-CoA hydratase domain-containing protein 3, mitochondrial-like [Haliotis rubra]
MLTSRIFQVLSARAVQGECKRQFVRKFSQTPRSLREQLTQTTQENGIRTICLNNPKKRNALSLAMLHALEDDLTTDDYEEDLRVIIITHTGPVFSAGHDLKELTPKEGRRYHQKVFDTCTEVMTLVQDLPVPVIAKVNGLATAAGCQLVASCDIGVATDTSRFATPGYVSDFFHRSGRYRCRSRRFRCRSGRFRCRSGRFRCRSGRFRCRSGRFRCRSGRFRCRSGRFRCRSGEISGIQDLGDSGVDGDRSDQEISGDQGDVDLGDSDVDQERFRYALLHGLVSRVVPEDKLDEETMKIANRICETSRSVTALGKATFYAQMNLERRKAYKIAGGVMVDNLSLNDGIEGIRAFIDKRKPKWTHTMDKPE